MLASHDDGVLAIAMAPPVAIGGWSILYQQSVRAGGTPFIVKSVASGFSAASGIQITNSGLGFMNIQLFAAEMSGRQDNSYFYRVSRTDSGFQSTLVEGYRVAGA